MAIITAFLPRATDLRPEAPVPRTSPVRRRVIVVGLGSIGRRHARLLAERSDLHVEGCECAAGAQAKTRMEMPGLEIHSSIGAALATRPDVVIIATPHDLHAVQGMAAMRTGAHVLCEKPLCVDCDQAAQMIACARDTGRHLGIGFQLHFHPGIMRLRELICEGAIGEVVHVHGRIGSFITLRNSASRYQQTMKGALLLDYAHQPDLIIWLLGLLPAGVTLTGLQAPHLPLSSNPNVMALSLDYDRPLLATVHLNYVQMPQRHEWEIVGDRGWIVLDADRGTLRVGRRDSETESTETVAVDRDLTYRREHQAFIDCLDGLRGPESSGEAAARSVELFTMAMQSWEEQRRIPCRWRVY